MGTAGQAEARREIARMIALRDAARFDEAVAVLAAAIEHMPDEAELHHALAMLLRQLGQPEAAEAPSRRALALAPDSPEIEAVLAGNLLAQGRYAEAWPLYSSRLRLPTARIPVPNGFPFPRWQDEDIAGKRIAVFPEQGFGDQIQFARFIPLLQRRGAEIVLLAREPLVDLFASSFPGAIVLPAVGSVDFPDPDYWTMALELARMAGATLETLPQPPYLRSEARSPTMPAGTRIGLMTRGNPVYANDAHRSLRDEVSEGLRERLPGSVIDLSPESTGARDFAETAALVTQLDAVVTVDTAVGHLAGALDKPCFLLLPGYSSDWRWMHGRDDSPWYPRHRLYRSTLEGDWSEAIDRLVRDVGEQLD